MPRLFAAALLACIVVSSATAQIVYEPVRYQFGGQTPFYYGGNDPDMFRFAGREYSEAHDGFAAARGDIMVHREVSQLRPHVYVDQFQRSNATVYGYTIDDARNDAYANATRYFRKRDIVAQAMVDTTGAWHVAPQAGSDRAGSIEIKPYVRPTVAPKQILIFPKGMLDRKLTPEGKQVADAR